MTTFHIQIAGQVARIHALFSSAKDHSARYLTELPPDLTITVTEADLRYEQAELDREAAEEGFRRRVFTDPFLERAAIQRRIADHLLLCDTLLFHGSAVAVDGMGYLFTARSGTGKSTHTRLWRQVFGDRAVMINDDKPFLQLTDHGIQLHGSPWSGKHGLDTNITVPLAGICILERSPTNTIRQIGAVEAMDMLRKQSYHPTDPQLLPLAKALTDRLGSLVPLWHMGCNKDPHAALTAWEAMRDPCHREPLKRRGDPRSEETAK